MKKTITAILIFLSIVALLVRFGAKPLEQALGLKARAGIRIESNPKAKVFINQKEVGETPYQDEGSSEGEYLISLRKEDATQSGSFSWQGYVGLNSGTLSVVNRDLVDNLAGSSGEVITLERGKGVTLISNPSGAEIIVDGTSIGRTPIVYTGVTTGEHQFLLSKDSYLKRTIRATLVDGYNLTINADLAISEADLTKLPTPPVTSSPKVIIKKTPTGFLRVRATPSTSGKEVGQVRPGEELILLEDNGQWLKIRLSDDKEGYIASQYAEKKSQ